MSSISDATSVLTRLQESGAVGPLLSIQDDVLHIDGRPSLVIPPERRAWSWRTTVNRSMLPISVSPESRRHLLYAVLQDMIRGELLLHQNTGSAAVLTALDPKFAPFDEVYRVPADRSSERVILFPIHVAVPLVFDTYERKPLQKFQTDKGFRGRFVDFFCGDEAGNFNSHLPRVLRRLFARTEGLTPLDRALVHALSSRVAREHPAWVLAKQSKVDDWWRDGDQWLDVYKPLTDRSEFRPLPDFAEQGRRLEGDVDAIAHSYGLSRIEQVAFIERIFAYHFSLYMLRLVRVLYRELHWSYTTIWPDRQISPWRDLDVVIRFHGRRSQVPTQYHSEYLALAEQLKEAYLLLPVLNNIELAVRAASIGVGDRPARISDGCWAEAKEKLTAVTSSPSQLGRVREILTFLAQMARHHVQLDEEPSPPEALADTPIEYIFDAVRLHYTSVEARREPKNHHQLVFDTVAGGGPDSFLQRQPFRHFAIGDELIYLLVFALFERRDPQDRNGSTCVPRERDKLRRLRLPLRDFEERLSTDLLVPADDEARRDLRASLGRLGLLDRLSDVGDGNFLRHPTGI